MADLEQDTRLQARAELLETLVRWFRDSVDTTEDAREHSERDRDYYDGIQWTTAEAQKVKERGQAPIVYNRIKPKIDFLLGTERLQRTQPKVLPRNVPDEGAADAATEGLRFVMADNDFNTVRSEFFDNLLVEGSGFAEVVAQPGPDGKVDPVINWIPWDRGFVDPFSRRRDMEDAAYRGQVIWMDRKEALRTWPGSENIIDATWTEAQGEETYDDKPDVWINTNRQRIRVVEIWYREGSRMFRAVFTLGGILEGPDESPYVDEDGIQEDPYVFASAHITRKGHRYGSVRQLVDIQDEINHRHSKFLHLLSVRQVQAEKGAVEDVSEAKRQLARADGWVETVPGMQMEVLPTGDMAQGQFLLLEEAKGEIDAIGANAALAGKGNEGASGRAIQARQQSGQAELGPVFDALRNWQHRTYTKAWNRMAQFWDGERWVRVTDNPESPKWIGINIPVTLGDELAQQKGGQLPPELQNDPRMGQVVRVENNITDLMVDIIIADAPDYVTLKQEQFDVIAGLAKAGVPIPPEALIKLSGVPEMDEVLKLLKGSPEEQEAKAKAQQEERRVQLEKEIAKIMETKAKTGKTVADTSKTEAEEDKVIAETIQIMRNPTGGESTVAG